jgi:site-specific DNA recombinase
LLSRKSELESLTPQRKVELASPDLVSKYVEDLRQFIDSSELTERKAFIKSFVKEIKVLGDEGRIKYTFPIPPDNHEEKGLGVLPTVRYGGRYRVRTCDLQCVILTL